MNSADSGDSTRQSIIEMTPPKNPDWVPILKALAEENRLDIVRLLIGSEMDVNTLSRELNTPEYSISKHLRILREAGLLEIEKDGQRRIYRISNSLREKLTQNSNVLDLGCCLFRFDEMSQPE